MITPDNITRSQARRLVQLLEQWTRAEIMARMAPLPWPEWGDYFATALKKVEEIRDLLFGTSQLVDLARLWHMPLPEKKKSVGYNRSQTRVHFRSGPHSELDRRQRSVGPTSIMRTRSSMISDKSGCRKRRSS